MQDFKFTGAKHNFHTVYIGALSREIDGQITQFDVISIQSVAAPVQRVDSGDQLFELKRFYEVIVGSEIQALNPVGGGDPGGLVCAGGQCRQEPRFEGFKANFTWRF